jgi:hypothetical protein
MAQASRSVPVMGAEDDKIAEILDHLHELQPRSKPGRAESDTWAATIDEPTDTATPALREALAYWFGTPGKPTVPAIGRPS